MYACMYTCVHVRMCMYVCMYVGMYVYMCVFVYMYMCICVYVRVCICRTYIYTDVFTFRSLCFSFPLCYLIISVNTCLFVRKSNQPVNTHTHTYIHTYIHTQTYLRTYLPTYLPYLPCIHTFIHTYIRTYYGNPFADSLFVRALCLCSITTFSIMGLCWFEGYCGFEVGLDPPKVENTPWLHGLRFLR